VLPHHRFTQPWLLHTDAAPTELGTRLGGAQISTSAPGLDTKREHSRFAGAHRGGVGVYGVLK